MESNSFTASNNRLRYRQWGVYLFYPTGVLHVWLSHHRLWVRILYTLAGLPVFLVSTIYFSILLFSSFYPSPDTSVGKRNDRSIMILKSEVRDIKKPAQGRLI
jgi:hypothetical protein